MRPENTHKLMGFYMEVLILGATPQYMFLFFFTFPEGCIGLISSSLELDSDTLSNLHLMVLLMISLLQIHCLTSPPFIRLHVT